MTTIKMQNIDGPTTILTQHGGQLTTDANGYINANVRDVAVLTSVGFIVASTIVSVNDPTVNSDSNHGNFPGQLWIDTIYPRVWVCQSAAVGAASWLLIFQVATTS